ncbi:hypothetical protein HRbin09_00378 [bacterium HR09]|nr:hypothetical protein HRbin09_00378 [bacterium HR09]
MVAGPITLCYKGRVRPAVKILTVATAALAVGLLFAPVLSFSLMGDDFQWVQHAHKASRRVAHLLADLDSFYRPTTTWTLALDRLFWQQRSWGFHLTNLLLHAAAAAMLCLVAGRFGLGVGPALAAGLLWGVSPFAEESAVSVAIRFEDLLLLCWLSLALPWPRPGERGNPKLLALLTVLAMLSKETWVVTPALVFALAWGFSRDSLAATFKKALVFFAGALLYVGVYFLCFPGDKNYFRYDLRVLAKVPHSLAAFLHLEQPVPLEFPFTLRGGLATVVVLWLVALAVRTRHPAGIFGASLLFAPMLPTLLVPYQPSRYLVAPYAGFLLLVLASLAVFFQKLGERRRRIASVAADFVALLVLLAHVFPVRADLQDWARVSDAHARLVRQAEAVAGEFPLDRPVAVVRADGTNVLRDIALSVEGWPKLFYVRGSDPAGLIDAAALFEWVLYREDLQVRPVVESPGSLNRRGAVLLYTRDGFRWVSRDEPNLQVAVEAWRGRGFPVRVIEVRPLPRLTL